MELKKFTVKKSMWLRGEGYMSSYLLRERDGKMCCLGFASLACGIDKSSIMNIKNPSRVLSDYIKYPISFFSSSLRSAESPIIQKIIDLNDDQTIFDQDRIIKLTDEFSKLGIEVLFED